MSAPELDKRLSHIVAARNSRFFRQRFVPAVVWIASIAVFVMVSGQQTGYRVAVGIVEVDEVIVSPLGDGTIRSLRVDLFDTVESGDVVAMMDDTLIVAELAIEEAQLGQIRAELDVERRQFESTIELSVVTELDNLRRNQLNEEQARLEFIELSVELEADRVKLERLKIVMERQEQLVREAIGEVSNYDEARLRHEELTKEIVAKQEALIVAQRNVDETMQRRIERQGQSTDPTVDRLVYLEPYLQRLKVQEARRQEIQQERLTLALRAPISGQVANVFFGPGETILSGNVLLSIQGTSSSRVIAYVDEEAVMGIEAGAEVEIRSSARPHIVASAKVLRSGLSLVELPSRIWSTPLMGDWGYPVLIGDVPEGVFLPGETVKVRFSV
jgi:multidrug resistance efflux pump